MMSQVLGGVGLFLIGMILTTDGLRAAAGDALRRVLLRFTGGPFKAMLSGALVTALVQSSSATTVATIGFVAAGLLTFHQSIGVIFGANLGTTVTSWVVAAIGLKFSVSSVALPLVGVGALLRLVGKGRAQHIGLAVAGFGVIFVGIDVLQAGMADMTDILTPSHLPGDTVVGRLLLMGLGFILTAVMQSSSAAMATTLTALHAETLSLAQAAAMAIGVNVGSTLTAAIAAIGASIAAKRTALAHLMFNGVTGVVAFAGLPLFVGIVAKLGEELGPGDAAIGLAIFHTVFNVVGIALLLPFSARFAGLIGRMIPESAPNLTRRLDRNVAGLGNIAIEAVRGTCVEVAGALFAELSRFFGAGRPAKGASERLEGIALALDETKRYMGELQFVEQSSEDEHDRHLSTLHALEHLGRLVDASIGAVSLDLGATAELRKAAHQAVEGLDAAVTWVGDPASAAPVESLRHLAEDLSVGRREHRKALLERTARGQVTPAAAERSIGAMRFVDDVAHAAFRIVDHLGGARPLDESV